MAVFEREIDNCRLSQTFDEILRSLSDLDEDLFLECCSEIITDHDHLEKFLDEIESQEILNILVEREKSDGFIIASSEDILKVLICSIGYEDVYHMLKDMKPSDKRRGDVFSVKR